MVDELIKLFPKSLEGWIKPSKAVDESHYLALTKSKHGWPVRPVYFQRSSHTAELYPCGFDSMDDIELCAEYHDVEHLLTNAGGMKKLAYKLTKENTKLKTSLKEAEERIKELEKVILCADIISWKKEELPDDKNMIVLVVLEKVRKNLTEAKVQFPTPPIQKD